jgi:hypothetical protein
MAKFVKDPDALLDYKVDFGDWLGTDAIVSAVAFTDVVASAQASGLRIANVSISASAAVVVWLSAGVLENEYTVTTRIWTSAGRRNDECFTVEIEQC